MKKLLSFFVLLIAVCQFPLAIYAQTVTPHLGLTIPEFEPGTWGELIANDLTILDTAVGTITTPVLGTFDSAVAFTADITPVQITANQNDYAGCVLVTNVVCRISTDASRNITGFAGGTDGALLFLYNVGSFNAVLKNLTSSSSANQLTINADITIGPNQGIILQYDSTSTKWRAASGISGGGGGQAADNDLTAIAALTGSGLAVRTGTDTWALRSITGIAGNITCTSNCDGVGGNPVLDLGNTAVQTDQVNNYGAFKQDFASGKIGLPTGAGASPAANELIVDSTTNKLKVNLNSTVQNVAVESGNVATATALAADPVGCTLANGQWTNDINASGASNCATVISSQSAAPSAAAVRYAGEINKDTRSYACATQAGLTYIGTTAGGNFAPIGAETDGYTTLSDGVNTAIPCGSDMLTLRGSGGINFDVYNGTGAFTNPPTNDGWEAVSSSAGDTTQFLKVCGTLTGGDSKDLTCETIALNGTTQIASVTVTYDAIYTARLCTTSACVANTTAAGTVTVRKASNNATITTLAPGASKSATQDLFVATLTATLNINGITTDTQPDVANDFVPTYDASAGVNKKVKLENVGSQQIYFDAGSITTDGTNCGTPTEQTLVSGPKTWAFSCADNGASIFYGKIRLPVAITTAAFTLTLFHATTETITFAGSFDAQCHAAGTAVSATWGTSQTANVAITTANQIAEATSAAVTPNGTCSKGSMLFWRYVVNAASFDTNAANAKVLSVGLKYQM